MIETRCLKNVVIFFANNFKFCAVKKEVYISLWLAVGKSLKFYLRYVDGILQSFTKYLRLTLVFM